MTLEIGHPGFVAVSGALAAAIFAILLSFFLPCPTNALAIVGNCIQYVAALTSIYVAIILFIRASDVADPILRGQRKRLSSSLVLLTFHSVLAFLALNYSIVSPTFFFVAAGIFLALITSTVLVVISLK